MSIGLRGGVGRVFVQIDMIARVGIRRVVCAWR